jgi:hypothetical protein
MNCINQTAENCIMQINKTYPVDGFVSLNIKSISGNNFFAGYVNIIDGKLDILSKNNQQLYQADYLASEQGGVLFQSGQIFQGIKEQVESYQGDDQFRSLSRKFISRLVSALPQVHSEESFPPEIKNVRVSPKKDGSTEICSIGTPGIGADLLIGQLRSNLREVASGEYCGYFILEEKKKVELEFSNPFGAFARSVLPLAPEHLAVKE